MKNAGSCHLLVENFMEEEIRQYELGKRHLANIMGEDPDNFTQEQIDVRTPTRHLSYRFTCSWRNLMLMCFRSGTWHLVISFVNNCVAGSNWIFNAVRVVWQTCTTPDEGRVSVSSNSYVTYSNMFLYVRFYIEVLPASMSFVYASS